MLRRDKHLKAAPWVAAAVLASTFIVNDASAQPGGVQPRTNPNDRYQGALPDEPEHLAALYGDKRHAALMVGLPVALTPAADRFGPSIVARLGYRVIPQLLIEVLAGWRGARTDIVGSSEDALFWGPALGLGLRAVAPFEKHRPYAAARVMFGWWRYTNPPMGVLTSFQFAPDIGVELGSEFRIGRVVLHAGALFRARFAGRAFTGTQLALGPQIGVGLDY